jgi:hypothetical protein
MSHSRIAQPAALLPPAVLAPSVSREIVGIHSIDIDEGIICCGSDQHYRPDEPPSTAHRTFVQTVSRFVEQGSLRAVVFGGDAFDFPGISRHPRIMW